MSCGCDSGSGYDGGYGYNGLCNADTPYPSVSAESVPSLISNLTYALYGQIQKNVTSGQVVWTIPCDPNNTASIAGIPRLEGEGLLCYIIRALNDKSKIFPADLSTGGPSWDASGNLTATRLLAYGQGGNPRNMAIGDSSLNANTSGTNNTAVGYLALYSNTTGSFNVAFGPNTLQTNSTGNNNVGVGQNTLTNNTSGSQNLAFGVYSLVNNTTGNNNVGNGQGSLQSNTTGSNNVAIGQAALKIIQLVVTMLVLELMYLHQLQLFPMK